MMGRLSLFSAWYQVSDSEGCSQKSAGGIKVYVDSADLRHFLCFTLMYSNIPGKLRRPRVSLTGSVLAMSAIRLLAIWLMRLPVPAMYDAGAAAPVYDRPNVIGRPHIHPVVGQATNIGCGRPVGNGQTPFGNRSISMFSC
jgi:hypothetical protein